MELKLDDRATCRCCRWAIGVTILIVFVSSMWLTPVIPIAIAPGLIALLFCYRIAHKHKREPEGSNSYPKGTFALDDSKKIDAVISLADRAHAETMRYREHVWKVVSWTVALLVATPVAAGVSKMTQAMPYWKELCVFFVMFVTVCGIRDVFFDYCQFVVNRNWQRRCERLLKFFEKDVYLTERSLLPEGMGEDDYRLKDCIGHLIQWWIMIYAVAMYSIFSIL